VVPEIHKHLPHSTLLREDILLELAEDGVVFPVDVVIHGGVFQTREDVVNEVDCFRVDEVSAYASVGGESFTGRVFEYGKVTNDESQVPVDGQLETWQYFMSMPPTIASDHRRLPTVQYAIQRGRL
jgi:hypothetical protein